MTTFLYIDYGPSPDIAVELKFSLATLMQDFRGREPEVVVYTDKPATYEALHPKLSVRPFGEDFARWSRAGLYTHRIKPCVLSDALHAIDGHCVLVDTDTFFRPGFADALPRAPGVAMDHFERNDPCPDCAGLMAVLPHAGRYAYDPATAVMFNSGLIAARKREIPALEDTIALIDAWLDAGIRQFNIEQIALSEVFRTRNVAVTEMKPYFEHYYRRSQKQYMRPRIAAWLARPAGWRPTRPFLEPSKTRVRWAHMLAKLFGRWSKKPLLEA
jgi:hypothetical protein